MKERNVGLVVAWLLAIATAWAGPIDENRARQIAADFMAGHTRQQTTMRKVRKAPTLTPAGDGTAAYYVFNASQGGYVIVAGDDRAPAVLGYSYAGTFADDDVPEAMQAMLDAFAEQITALDAGAQAAELPAEGTAIPPLVEAQWSQNQPFNTLLPLIPSTGKRAVVGCVATALAQVMRYWQWPAQPSRPLPAYTSETLKIEMPELPVTDFAWTLMQDNYEKTDATTDAALAAATLSLYCDQALQMDFMASSSGAVASNIPHYGAKYFDYDAGAHMVSRGNYSTQGWADLLLSELAAGRPVIYSASKHDGGHAFICDGYDGNGLFHINWGWNGSSDGYFLLNVLDPDQQGTGSAGGDYGYIMSQGAIVGFQPNRGGHDVFEFTAVDVRLNRFNGTRETTADPFKITVSAKFFNYTSDTINVRYGWGLFENGEMIERIASSYNLGLAPDRHMSQKERELSVGIGRTSGTYGIMPMYSEYGQDNWRPCVGADRNFIEVTIDGNQCQVIGHGTAAAYDYAINEIGFSGTMHKGRPVNMDVNLTNTGLMDNAMLYMFVDGKFSAAGYVGLAPGETGDIRYSFLTNTAGTYSLTWSWNSDGSNPIATRDITITEMPAAQLTGTVQVQNVTDANNKIITSDRFCAVLTITNNGTTAYDEDITARLYKHTDGNSGTVIQEISHRLTLAPGQSTTLQFDLTDVNSSWKYFAFFYYYSEGTMMRFVTTPFYTINVPKIPADLSASDANILNLAEDEAGNEVIDSEKFSYELTITNNGTRTYTDYITAKLSEKSGDEQSTQVQTINQYLTLGPGQRTTLRLEFDNVADGHKYYANTYFHSLGQEKHLGQTREITIVFPVMPGDVNGDSVITIADVTALVNIILGKGEPASSSLKAADVNKDGGVTIADVTALVNIILGK